MVSNASDDLPEPDGPVTTVTVRRGISRSNPLRLFWRAPRTTMLSFTFSRAEQAFQTAIASHPKSKRQTEYTPKFRARADALESPYQTSEEEEYDGAGGGDPDRAEIKLSSCDGAPAEEARPQPAADERADDSEKNRDDTTRRVPPWHQKLGQCSGDEA